MYVPRRYEEKDADKINTFLKENSFAILVSVKDGLPIGTHIPLQLEKNAAGEDVLVGHISKGNEQRYTLVDGAKVLAIFPGPHAYISPRWYTQMKVPTWNYIAVHVYGTVKIMEGEELRAALSRLMDVYEGGMERPVKIGEVPEKELNADLRGIVGFEIKMEEVQAAYKLSQNRDEESYHRVMGELEKGGEVERKVAEEMERREEGLFGERK
ncbi:MAG: FMN-binding negative transcriptional regulator [Bacteroidetes bacterium]|nr:FMN-binding negative transcriptional regulator [Bacteroidota bacterium]